MKVRFLVVALATTLLASLSACNKVKDWQCECTLYGDPIVAVKLDATKKKDAKTACKQLESENSSLGAKCKLDKE